MKKKLILLLLSFSALGGNAQGLWTRLTDFGGAARHLAVGFSINGKGYIGTGYDGTGPLYNKDFWEYDTATTAWTQKADFGGVARSSAVGFAIGSKGYIGTGEIGSQQYTKDFWEYDPSLNAWTQKADFGGTARYLATGFGTINKGYIGTGSDINDLKKDFWEYNPSTDIWLQKTDFGGVKRMCAVGFSLGNKGYIGTGGIDFWEYNPSLNTWTQKANYGGGQTQGSIGFSIGGKGYIATGNGSKFIWEWDSTTNQWSQKTNFGGTGRSFAVGFSIGNKGYIGTGSSPVAKDFWVFDPALCPVIASFTSSANTVYMGSTVTFTGTSIGATSCTWLADGIAFSNTGNTSKSFAASGSHIITLIVNGVCSDTISTTINVLTGGWVKKAVLLGGEREGATGFSIGGKGYIATGSNKNDLWEWDQATNGWTQKANLPAIGRRYGVSFSIGNKGYLGTGNGSNNINLKDFWEYDPSTNVWLQKADFAGTARKYAAGFSCGNYGYILTGNDGTQRKDFWEYDPGTDSWLQKTDFTGAIREQAVGFSIGQKGYFGTGSSGSELNDFWEWNQITDIWTQKANLSPVGRIGAVGFSMNGKGIIGTGYGNGSLKNDFWEYDPFTSLWTKIPGISISRQYAIGFSVGNRGYVGTGQAGSIESDFWEYNPNNCGVSASFNPNYTTNATALSTKVIGKGNFLRFWNSSSTSPTSTIWQIDGVTFSTSNYSPDYTFNNVGSFEITLIVSNGTCSDTAKHIITVTCSDLLSPKANLPSLGRSYPVGFSIGNKGYIGMGYYHDNQYNNYHLKDLWEYDPIANAWTQKANFPGTGRYGAVGFSIGNKGYVGTGISGTGFNLNTEVYNKDFWEFNPSTNSWAQKANFGGAGRGYAVGFSIANKGYIGTGLTGSVNVKDFWEYDPVSDSWLQKADFGGVAKQRASGFSIGQYGYIAAGTPGTQSFGGTCDFWQFNPANNSWTRKRDSPNSTYMNFSFSTNTKGYFGGYGTRINEYIPAEDIWIVKDNIPYRDSQGSVAFAIGNHGYFGFGHDFSGNMWEITVDTCSPCINPNTFILSSTICAGSSITVGSHTYTTNGTYIDTLPAFNSCDSVITTNLTVLPANTITQSPVVCAGHSITIGSHTYTTNGTYTDTLTAFNSCDSIVTTNLTVLPANAFTWSTSICAGQSISIGNHVYNTNGTYTDTLIAFNLCDSIVTTHLAINQLPVATITPNGPAIFCTGGNVVLDAGTGFVNYLWSNGSTSQSIQITSSENDSVMVTDMNGCSATSSATAVSVSPLPILVITDPSILCSPNTIDISLSSVTFGSSTGTLSYWKHIVGTISLNSSYYTVIDTTGTYYIRLDSSGCSNIKPITVTINSDCVWPGDANKDSLVNNYDLLPIGLYYSQAGSPRTNISNLWQAYLSTNWGTTQSNGSDIKHVDCNGDGLINNNDTLAININFSLTHAVVANNFNQERLPNPDIYIVTSSNSYNAGDWVNAEVWAGSSSIPVSNLYGIAFNINYDASLVQLGTESLTYPNSWLGIPGNNAIKISKIDALATTAYGGLTRIDHINVNGYGKIADFKFQAKNSITSTSVLHLYISRYLANDALGAPLLFNTLADSIIINPLVTGTLETITNSEITIAPNPFTLQTTITFNEEQKHGIIKIMDILGKEIKTIPFTGKQLIIEKGSMQAGIYFIQVISSNDLIVNRKVVIQ